MESAAQTRPDHRDVTMPRPLVALATTPRDCLRVEVAIAVTLMMLIAVGAGSASAEEGDPGGSNRASPIFSAAEHID